MVLEFEAARQKSLDQLLDIVGPMDARDNRKKVFWGPEPLHFEPEYGCILKSRGERVLSGRSVCFVRVFNPYFTLYEKRNCTCGVP